ncbi:hypothetical protein KO500_04380 [Cellulophaga baltica]|uniref:hypothetical protein n=1 Tax=Cellulophaga TaxID=104264 RepID=UPI001C077CA6|nr:MULTISPECIES: hypothetical protein [Cellulophaga]MBU2995653.1 hypothetical protein [Cellulophaga baltica]MDO6767047.1 hypothetical protein [Cellulophaga sp. 1_MG-2023]
MKTFMSATLILVVSLIFCSATTSCENESELFTEAVLLIEEEVTIDLENAIVIPEDFDWTNIPETYKDSILDIQFDFDFEEQTIELPADITLYFSTGSFSNGELTGDNTTIISQTKYQVFDDIDLAGSYDEDQYLMPYWFGAVMDGVTDDRDVFVETLDQATNISGKVMVDKDIFLDVEETGAKSIFLDDNSWIEGDNDANIIVNSLYSPAFYIALVENVTIKNLVMLYDQQYDASFGWDTSIIEDNITQLRYYLEQEKNIIFTSSTPLWNGGPVSFRALFSIEAAENVTFENVDFKAKGATADTFIQEAIKFKEQFSSDQEVVSDLGLTAISKQVSLTNISMDGVIMGIQGIVEDLLITNFDGHRYSDVQSASGNYIGGADHWMPPPHLIYLNEDSSINNLFTNNVQITNVMDYGDYVGSTETRGSSGYCNSLKLVGNVQNVVVANYTSYRRDGLGDFGNIINGDFSDMYSEYTSDIFDSSLKFYSMRFVGPLTNSTIENVTIKDMSDLAEIYPMGFAEGDYVTLDNIQIYVNELNTESYGFFGISGSNNTIINSSISIENHTSTDAYRGVIYHNEETLESGANNYYDVTVNGWRSLDENCYENKCRMIFANASNTNTNYAKITDISNNMVSEQTNNTLVDTWTRTETVDLGSGTSEELEINIPYGYMLQSISANTVESLASGVEISIGTSATEKSNLMSTLSKSTGTISALINEVTSSTSNRSIYLFSDSDFDSTGSVEVTIELTHESQYD